MRCLQIRLSSSSHSLRTEYKETVCYSEDKVEFSDFFWFLLLRQASERTRNQFSKLSRKRAAFLKSSWEPRSTNCGSGRSPQSHEGSSSRLTKVWDLVSQLLRLPRTPPKGREGIRASPGSEGERHNTSVAPSLRMKKNQNAKDQ